MQNSKFKKTASGHVRVPPTAFRYLLLMVMLAGSFCVAISAQTRTVTADAIEGSGSFSGQLYTNKVMGFTMLAPGGWNFYTHDQNQAIVKANRERNGAGSDHPADKDMAVSAANTQILFQAIPPLEVAPATSALLSSGVERLQTPLTLKKYVEKNKQLVLRAPGVKIFKDDYPLTFGGAQFIAFDVEGRTGERPYKQRYIVTIRKNVVLFFVVTLYDNKQEPIVAASLKTLHFGK